MASNLASLKALAASVAKVASDKAAATKLCDDAVKATPHDLDIGDFASAVKAAPDAAAIVQLCGDVAARK